MRSTKDLKDIVSDVRGQHGRKKSTSLAKYHTGKEASSAAQRIEETFEENYNFENQSYYKKERSGGAVYGTKKENEEES